MRAACIAIVAAIEAPPLTAGEAAGGGGGLGADVVGGSGGGGGADVGAVAEGWGGGGGGAGGADTLRVAEGGGGGARPTPGKGGGARGGTSSGVDFVENVDDGLEVGLGGGFLRFASMGFTTGGEGASAEGGGGGRTFGVFGTAGGLGAPPTGADDLGVRESVSLRYAESGAAPVSIPPRFLSLGIPPANKPPSCGADGSADAPSPPCPPRPPSLLLRIRLPGAGGAKPVGGFNIPGIGGAPPTGGAAGPPEPFEISGADLSFVTVFFSRAPLVISVNNAD